jgi:high affinity Mn2+ porin
MKFQVAMHNLPMTRTAARLLAGWVMLASAAASAGQEVESALGQAAPVQSESAVADQKNWDLRGQLTHEWQWHPAFTAPYSGTNSMNAARETKETTDVTLYAGLRLSGNSEIWANLEEDQGFGLSDTLGLAGFSSGEAYKVGESYPYFRIPRFFYRKTIGLGGKAQHVEADANQFDKQQTADNVILTVGKFSVVDVFDTNAYAHDPRGDFMNWSIVDAGAFDYAADAWGYSIGGALEWTRSDWTLRGGLFDLAKTPNNKVLDPKFSQYETVVELEKRFQLSNHPGKVKLLSFLNRGNMGNYADAVQLAQQTHATPETALVRRFSSRPGLALNLEQEIAPGLGGFMRASVNRGSKEAHDFTEINRSCSAGLALSGSRWGRKGDTAGAAAAVNALSGAAQAYFAAGGIGILIGDGNLNYGEEKILETYYSLAATEHIKLAFDYQHVANPAYNRDRGPISISSARLHVEF